MLKTLKPYTIIPPNLYVCRDADRQIQNIINDMGRPGYVLVSRQMGKTNLLLNAKRELEGNDDVFVYVDLSNPFETAKSCFENIIDIAIETNSERLIESAAKIMESRRHLANTPPHKQHTNELRTLLKSLSGKLVIILDEIDALTKTQYSDQVFAQIRSIYFSRVNFPELARLTYILSGVIEPTEIIKDPKISPFNIGQKIFLNDFSMKEFESFLERADLSLPQEIKDRIFYWTGGNPRMTWDVCSEVENKKASGNLSIDTVDSIILDMYLTTYDRPPIDNIREIVKQDREIRNAIIEIEFEKGRQISDKIKSKLYLSGITNYEDSDIRIKNNIIRQSLNVKWIQALEEEEKGLAAVAIDMYQKNNYIGALATFERFLDENQFQSEESSLCYYYMGYAAYRLSDFKKALHYFDNAVFDVEDDSKWYYRVVNLKGLINYYAGEIEESLRLFKIVIDSGKKDENYARALLNFGSISLKSERLQHKDEAIAIFQDIINETKIDKSKLREELVHELKYIAHYNLAQIQRQNGDIKEAQGNLAKALSLSGADKKITIMLALVEITDDKDEKYRLLNELIDFMLDNKLQPAEIDPEKPLDFNLNIFKDIVINAYIVDREILFNKIKTNLHVLGSLSIGQHLYNLALYSMNTNKTWESALKILEELYINRRNVEYALDELTEYKTLKWLAYFSDATKSTTKHLAYLSLFEQKQLTPIDYLDMEIIANIIYTLSNQKQFDIAMTYVDLINSLKSQVEAKLLINYLVIYNLELNIYTQTAAFGKAREKAVQLLELANNDDIRRQKSNLLGDTGLEIIRQNAEYVLNQEGRKEPYRKLDRVYGRNEIVKVKFRDGTIAEAKYKKIEAQLKAGECSIL